MLLIIAIITNILFVIIQTIICSLNFVNIQGNVYAKHKNITNL